MLPGVAGGRRPTLRVRLRRSFLPRFIQDKLRGHLRFAAIRSTRIGPQESRIGPSNLESWDEERRGLQRVIADRGRLDDSGGPSMLTGGSGWLAVQRQIPIEPPSSLIARPPFIQFA